MQPHSPLVFLFLRKMQALGVLVEVAHHMIFLTNYCTDDYLYYSYILL